MDGIELRFTDISAPPPTHTQVTHQTYAYTSSNGRTVQHTTSSNDYNTPITQAKWFKPAIIAAVIILLVAILILIIVLPIVLTSKSNSLDTKSTNTTSIVTTSNTTTGWTRTGNMTASRRSHTASVLPNGKVLITGGYTADSNVPLATAEVYDPSTRTWTKTQNNMNYGRIGHSASVLSNGTVLVTGAYEIFATELYDPTTNTWIQRASMNISRVSHTASVLSNGTVVVIGGYDSSFEAIENNAMGYVNTTELYDPSKNMWAKVAKMNTARAYHRASTLLDGRILITGGIGGEDSATLNSAELYDPIKNNWTVATNMIIPRTSHTVSVLSNGTVLVIGGYYDSSRVYYNSAELYDPSKNAWTVVANMSVPRASHTASVLSNGKVLVTGGFYGDGNSRVTLNTAELYDPTTNTWTKAANMTVSRTAHTASRLSTGNILIAGGDGGISSDGMSYIGTLNIAELY